MRQAKVLNAVELKRLNAVVEGTRHAVRNATAVALSFYAGTRACEIAALTIGDVFDAAGAVRDTIYLTAAQTKGSTGNTVYVNKRLTAALRRYAATYPKRLQHPQQALIFSAKGAGFTAQTMVNLFAVFYKSAAIAGASSHSGRRQYVSALASMAINPRVIQALARHAHLNTTMRYMDVNDTKLRTAVEMVNF
jgi:integrase/recombinase XerD